MKPKGKPATWSSQQLAWKPIWGPISTGETGLWPITVPGQDYLVRKCQRGSIAATSSAMMKTHHYCHKMSTWPWISAFPS